MKSSKNSHNRYGKFILIMEITAKTIKEAYKLHKNSASCQPLYIMKGMILAYKYYPEIKLNEHGRKMALDLLNYYIELYEISFSIKNDIRKNFNQLKTKK